MNFKIITTIIVVSFGAILFLVLNNTLDQENNQELPNIIVIITDDLDVNTLNQMLEIGWMPNLQEYIINRGTEFKNSFVTNPVCCPSRATFLTGQYAHNHNILNNAMTLEFNDNHTLATWLKEEDYRTGLIGRYLNGYGTKIDASYVAPGWDEWKVLVQPHHNDMFSYKINDNGIMIDYRENPLDSRIDFFAKSSADFINQSIQDETPFFLYIPTRTPHDEKETLCSVRGLDIPTTHPVERYVGTAKDLILKKSPSFNENYVFNSSLLQHIFLDETSVNCVDLFIRDRIESIRAIDDLIGTVVDTLIHNNKFDDTIIIFTSDNGLLLGEHRLVNKKQYPYEESIRVPLYITAPEFRTSQTSSQLVLNNDLAPTILELAGATTDISMDGTSLIPLLSNPNEDSWRNKFFVAQYSEKGVQVRTQFEDGKMIESIEEVDRVPHTYKMIRTTQYSYIEYVDSLTEFYDLEADPYQLNNQIDCTSTICQEKIIELQNWLYDLKDCGEGSCQILENKQ